MRDTEGKKSRNRPDEQPPEAFSDSPEKMQMIRKGLRIWVRVAIRSYMGKHEAALPLPEAAPDGGGEEDG